MYKKSNVSENSQNMIVQLEYLGWMNTIIYDQKHWFIFMQGYIKVQHCYLSMVVLYKNHESIARCQ